MSAHGCARRPPARRPRTVRPRTAGRLAQWTLAALCNVLVLQAAPGATVPGFMPGELAVDELGAATYRIPIDVPPGTAGTEPSLALVYNSHAGNGLLGVGWSLAGLSVIHRCPRTLARDGERGGVEYGAGDRFCLDGQRLVSVRGRYGAHRTEYRTEIERFSKIVSYGSAGAGPAWFKVWTRSGEIREYGRTRRARIEASGKPDVRVWALSRTTDSAGNYLDVCYFEDRAKGVYRATRIDYTGNRRAGSRPYASVRFVYERRPDRTLRYLGGSPIAQTHRLVRIRTFVGARPVRTYHLRYEASATTGRSRLTRVRECASDGDCLRPTVLRWRGGGQSYASSRTLAPPEEMITYVSARHRSGMQRGVFVDVDGDGLADWVRAFRDHAGRLRRVTYLNTGDGWRPHPGYRLPGAMTSYHVRGYEAGIRHGEFADVNGDGLPDWVQALRKPGGHYRRKTFLKTGDGWRRDRRYDLPGILTDYAVRGYEAGIRHGHLVDLDGDGLPDWVQAVRKPGGHYRRKTFLNTGRGWRRDPASTLPGILTDYAVRGYEGGIRHGELTDVNGDGLPDWVQALRKPGGRYRRKTFLNTGRGWRRDPAYTLPGILTDYAVRGYEGGIRHGELADVNGDGLPEWVQAVRKPGGHYRRKTFVNTGTGWRRDRRHELPGVFVDYAVRGYDAGIRHGQLVDVNGDGVEDWITAYRDHTGARRRGAALARGAGADRLTRIVDGLGARTRIAYAPLTDDRIHVKDGDARYPRQDFQGPLHVVSEVATDDGVGGERRTTYAYGGAEVDLHGRGLLGFRWIESKDEQSGVFTTTDYRQDFPYVGRVAASTSFLGDGTRVTTLRNTWRSLALNGGRSRFPYVARSVAQSYELNHSPGNRPVTTVTTRSTYDHFGNPTRITVTTRGGGKTFVKDTRHRYADDTRRWHLGRLVHSRVTATAPNGARVTRSARFAYHAATGLLVEEMIEPGSALERRTRYRHDRFGNRIAVTVAGAGAAARTTRTRYDARGRFAVETTNALGHRERRAFDPGSGKPTRITDPNGLTTTTSYDGFGRKVRAIRPDGTRTTWRYAFCSKQCPARAVYALTTEASGKPGSTAYFDRLNREIRTRTEGFDGTPILRETVYDARGRVARRSRPYYAGERAHYATFTYDAAGRRLSRRAADGGITRYRYDGLRTTVVDPLGRRTLRITNARDEVVEIRDHDGGRTTHAYDPFGNLIRTTDAAGNVTRMRYDRRGRKTAMTDPDMGRWIYRYNALDELVRQTDAKRQTVTFVYDRLGRMTHRREREGVTLWRYDGAPNGIGKLHRVSGPNGYLREHRYDRFGRRARTTTTITMQTFAVSRTYDRAGRLARITYPTGFAVDYAYTRSGYLAAIRDARSGRRYWIAEQRDAEGHVLEAALGNGLTTTREYDPRSGRIRTIRTGRGLARTAQHWRYDFDRAGNLKRRQNLKQGLTETFGYDSLDRLTSARLGDRAGGRAVDVRRYRYDAIGNLTYRPHVGAYRYGEGAAGPHAVTRAGRHTYRYDANGNMTRGADRTISWTSFNKPERIVRTSTRSARISSPSRGSRLSSRRTYGRYRSSGRGSRLACGPRHVAYTYARAGAGRGGYAAYGRGGGRGGSYAYGRAGGGRGGSYAYGRAGGGRGGSYRSASRGRSGFRRPGRGARSYASYRGRGSSRVYIGRAGEYGGCTSAIRVRASAIRAVRSSPKAGSYVKPVSRSGGSGPRSTFLYGPDRSRIQQVRQTGAIRTTVKYVGRLFEQVTATGDPIERRHYIYAGDARIALLTTRSDRTRTLRYLHRDHLGSIDAVTDARGGLIERLSYDPHGKRRSLSGRFSRVSIVARETERGFTGHEHLDEFGLIHMNGRIYDPGIGRFLSPDPVVQFPASTQGLNRYTYVNNNPLSFTDPTGLFLDDLFDAIFDTAGAAFELLDDSVGKVTRKVFGVIDSPILRTGAAIAASAAVGGFVQGAIFESAFASAMAGGPAASMAVATAATQTLSAKILIGTAGGFAGALVGSGGDLGSALIGGATGAAFGFVGGSRLFGSVGQITPRRIVAHGLVGGTTSAVRGSSFLRGFASSAFTKSLSGSTHAAVGNNAVAGAVTSAVIGGASTELAGGKFANGASTGAFAYLFNEAATDGGFVGLTNPQATVSTILKAVAFTMSPAATIVSLPIAAGLHVTASGFAFATKLALLDTTLGLFAAGTASIQNPNDFETHLNTLNEVGITLSTAASGTPFLGLTAGIGESVIIMAPSLETSPIGEPYLP